MIYLDKTENMEEPVIQQSMKVANILPYGNSTPSSSDNTLDMSLLCPPPPPLIAGVHMKTKMYMELSNNDCKHPLCDRRDTHIFQREYEEKVIEYKLRKGPSLSLHQTMHMFPSTYHNRMAESFFSKTIPLFKPFTSTKLSIVMALLLLAFNAVDLSTPFSILYK